MLTIDEEIDLRAALEELTPRQREALVIRLEGYTQQEIGERLTVCQSAVSRLLTRARQRSECHIPEAFFSTRL